METVKDVFIEVLPYVLGGYEALIRIVPTKKDKSVVGNILKGLVFLSDLLNRKQKK